MSPTPKEGGTAIVTTDFGTNVYFDSACCILTVIIKQFENYILPSIKLRIVRFIGSISQNESSLARERALME